ncbi:MAG: MATE family efflux transporter [Deferribacteraceae bacterium]|jgi:putative MATE family efflux protein|nr:MATE family efflux transporter [Deferribacteraceae bacterium]
MDSQKILGEAPVGKLLFQYSAPAIVSFLVNAAYSFIDRIFIGNIPEVGSMAITGVGVSLPVLTILLAFAMLIASGAATNMSLRLGEGRIKDAETLIGNALTLAIIFGVVFTLLYLLFADRILEIFGASENSMRYAKEYMNLIVVGIVPWFIAMTLNFVMRADGSPRRAAVIMIIGAVINIPLDVLFIFGLDMGIGGAALATSISEMVTMLLALDYFLRGKSNLKFSCANMRLQKPLVKMILLIGLTPCFIQLAISLSQAVTNSALRTYGGDLSIGAMTTIVTIIMLFFMPLFGLAQGMQPIVGYNYGAQKLDRAKRAFVLATIWGTAFFFVAIIFTLGFPEIIVGWFNRDPELFALTIDGIRKDTCTLPLAAVGIIGSTYILSVGKAQLSMLLSMLRQIIVLIPTLIFLPRFIGLDGVWFAQPVADVISTVVVIYVLVKEFNGYKRRGV